MQFTYSAGGAVGEPCGLIFHDGAYGTIRWNHAMDAFPDFGLTFGNPGFVHYVEAYGAKGRRVGRTEDLASTLDAAFAMGGVHLVASPVDYSRNERVLVDGWRARVLAPGAA
jgi:acetolactate synthase I/II/III large subunit